MRRGLMDWSHDELPPATLAGRVSALLDAMDEAGLDALLVYTNFTRPGAVHWLTGFTPYWNQGVLVLTRAAGAVFVCALSQRVADWMRSVSRLDDVLCTPQIGRGIAAQIGGGAQVRAGVVDLGDFPGQLLTRIAEAASGVAFVDATDLFAGVRATADGRSDRIGDTLVAMARSALGAVEAAAAQSSSGNMVVAAAERVCRAAGAEELLTGVAPDLDTDPRLRRLDGDCTLADRFALQLSIAYKGIWTRCGRSFVRGETGREPEEPWCAALMDAIDRGAPAETVAAEAATRTGGDERAFWRIEGPRGGLPLAILAGSAPYAAIDRLPPGLLSLSVRARTVRGWWFAAAPVRATPGNRDHPS